MARLRQVGEEFLHPFDGGTTLVLSSIPFQLVVFQVG